MALDKKHSPTPALETLLSIMARLRDPDGGCPWDVEQDFASIAPYTVEEAYEVADAIDRGDMDGLMDELGDLLFQVVFHAQMAAEEDLFDFDAVAARVAEKMIRRHPHVFGDGTVKTAEEQTEAWEDIKAKERAAGGKQRESALDGLPVALPALLRALKLQKRAARVGFDWADVADVQAKIEEEIGELSEALSEAKGESTDDVREEFGDLLFVMVNLARHLDIDPEDALRRANAKFERRFRTVEDRLADQGKTPEESDLSEMDALWDAVKRDEKDTENN